MSNLALVHYYLLHFIIMYSYFIHFVDFSKSITILFILLQKNNKKCYTAVLPYERLLYGNEITFFSTLELSLASIPTRALISSSTGAIAAAAIVAASSPLPVPDCD